jgi:aminoglycoside phosphotransferase (APT) family kinase protein
MTTSEQDSLEALLRQRGHIRTGHATLTPLTGGVSSEIYLVEDGDRRFVVKRALAKLKVQAEWFADTSRNRTEQAYMRAVAAFRPDAVPGLLFCDEEAGCFGMEFLDGFQNWKSDLLAGHLNLSLARQAGVLLGEIHARTWGDEAARTDFATLENFDQLRIDPYLRTTAARHPEVRDALLAEAARLRASAQCLLHGDFSPKNMMHRDGRLVVLDCEVACYGDAAFDLSFFLNHLFLKSLYHAPTQLAFPAMIDTALHGYRGANPLHNAEVEAAAVKLLPMLMLARVDGKSPVEYLTSASKRDFLRGFAQDATRHPAAHLDALSRAWFAALGRSVF